MTRRPAFYAPLLLDKRGRRDYNKSVMKYVELTVHTTGEASELVADVMWNYTSYGVTVCDAADIIALQRDSSVFWDYMDESLVQSGRTDVLVKCFFEPAEAAGKISSVMRDLNDMRGRGGDIPFGTLEEGRREIEGDDWIDVWKKHFRPIHLGCIVIVPEWIAYERAEGEEVVLLDSNMAFGTGEHETTSMCVELMQQVLHPGDTVIDVGCGSGILGISALKLGAGRAYLTDIDPVAVQSATHNCRLNGVEERAVVALSNLLDDSSVQGEVVLANITAEVLALLAPSIPKNLKAGGTLILSGIIESRLALVKERYLSLGLTPVEERRKGEWFALVFRH